MKTWEENKKDRCIKKKTFHFSDLGNVASDKVGVISMTDSIERRPDSAER
jgi:uncharacterized DUF497 family protein